MTSPKSQAAGTPIEAVDFDAIGREGEGHNRDWCAGWNAHLVKTAGEARAHAAALATAAHEAREAMREEAAKVAAQYGSAFQQHVGHAIAECIRAIPITPKEQR